MFIIYNMPHYHGYYYIFYFSITNKLQRACTMHIIRLFGDLIKRVALLYYIFNSGV